MPRIAVVAIVVAVTAAITWRYPLFHVLSLKETTRQAENAAFNAAEFATKFWDERLTPALEQAADAAQVIAAFKTDPADARKRMGRSVGITRSTLLLVRGKGQIAAVEDSRIGVMLEGNPLKRNGSQEAVEPDLWLSMGPIFSNAIRDSTGLLLSRDFSNSQDFNSIAKALNGIVEQRVMPGIKGAATPGKSIRFAACAEVPGGQVKLPLTLIPLQAVIEQTADSLCAAGLPGRSL